MTTTLGFQNQPYFKTEKRTVTFTGMAEVKDNWGAAYGRVVTTSNLRKDGCGDEVGC